jgi:hypothetical protein
MKNFKVIIKTDREDCPYRYRPYCAEARPSCLKNKKKCTEKNCPFKEVSLCLD